jgi:hypothetical protein
LAGDIVLAGEAVMDAAQAEVETTIRFALGAAVVAPSAPPAVAEQPARTVISNVQIVTLDDRGVIEGAVVVRDGRIEHCSRRGPARPARRNSDRPRGRI